MVQEDIEFVMNELGIMLDSEQLDIVETRVFDYDDSDYLEFVRETIINVAEQE